MRPDRKELLNELEFAWRAENTGNHDDKDKKWHQQHEKLVEFQRKNGHCTMPTRYEQDKSPLTNWVCQQQRFHAHEKLRPDRKELLNELEFVWSAETAVDNDTRWHLQCEKMVELQRKNGHLHCADGTQGRQGSGAVGC
jgi:hypothetical protein